MGITFQGDPIQVDVDTFVTPDRRRQGVLERRHRPSTASGPLGASPPQHLSETAPATLADGDVQAWLTAKINAGGGFPQPDANTMYVIFYPPATTVTLDGGALCQDFQGYHSDYAITPGQLVSYAVVGRCPPPVPGLAEIDEVTAEASHEIIEMATDPLPQDKPAYSDVDADHMGWAMIGGGAEIGDLCAPFPDSFYKPAGLTTLVQRVWSNAAAAAGHDPCQPDGASPYFNSAPVLTDTLQVVGSPFGSFTTKGVKIPVGSSKTIELDLYSDAPTSGPWNVSVLDVERVLRRGAHALVLARQDAGQERRQDPPHHQGPRQEQPRRLALLDPERSGGVSSVWIGLVGS